MRIAYRLGLAGVGIAALIGVVGYDGFWACQTARESIRGIDAEHHVSQEVARLEATVLEQVHEGMHLIAFEDEDSIGKLRGAGKKFREDLAAIGPELNLDCTSVLAEHQELEKMFDGVVKAYEAGELTTREQRRNLHNEWCSVSASVIEKTRLLQAMRDQMLETEHRRLDWAMGRIGSAVIFVTILAVCLATGIGFVVARAIVDPIIKLRNAAVELGKGKGDTRISVGPDDEIGQLAQSFNEMAEKLEQYHDSLRERGDELERANGELKAEIEERKRVEGELRASEHHMQVIVDNLPYLIFQVDKAMKVIWANRLANGFNPDAVGKACYEAYACRDNPCEGCNALAAMRTAQIATSIMHHKGMGRTQGDTYWEKTAVPLQDSHGAVAGAIELCSDITERRRAEEKGRQLEAQLYQAQKMEAVGTLAAGTAHEFNNLLQAISIHARESQTAKGDEGRDEALERIQDRIRQAASLTKGLLSFARSHDMDRTLVYLADPIGEVGRLIRHTLDHRIEVLTQVQPGLWPVKADVHQIHQVLLNLCLNARDAMPDGGRLLIEASNRLRGESGKQREFVRLRVQDSGVGMTAEAQGRIFDPFFTTKEVGKGTGLGLAMVYGIVQSHGGAIEVVSEVGHGSRFDVFLPATKIELPSFDDAPRSGSARPASGTVLPIDD